MNSERIRESLKFAETDREEVEDKVKKSNEYHKELLRQHPLYKQAIGFFQSPAGKEAIKQRNLYI